jgi:hypothetical protein
MAALVEGDVIRVTINGVAAGQAVKNVLWYFLETLVGDVDSTLIAPVVSGMWQAQVLPALSDSYEVQSYVVQRFAMLLQSPNTVPVTPIRLRQRFNVKHTELGGVADVGGVAGAALPTYVAAAFTKTSAGPQDTIYKPVAAHASVPDMEKQMRSSMRIGTLPEAYTEAADQNVLTAAAVAALGDIGTDIMTFNVPNGGSNANFDMVIPSEFLDGLPRPSALVSPPIVMGFQYVDAITLQPLVSSQVSRKARPGGA